MNGQICVSPQGQHGLALKLTGRVAAPREQRSHPRSPNIPRKSESNVRQSGRGNSWSDWSMEKASVCMPMGDFHILLLYISLFVFVQYLPIFKQTSSILLLLTLSQTKALSTL